jgi:hypothetical protein
MNRDQELPLYRYIPVWRRHRDHLRLYRVVEMLGVGFVVQSCDYFHPDTNRENAGQLDQQFLELLSEIAPEKRMRPLASIQAAVADFDGQFQDGA